MSRVFDFIYFLRPLLHIPIWIVYLHFSAVSQGFGYLTLNLPPNAMADLGLLSLLFAGTYALNQIFDIETDRANDKLYFLPKGIITIRSAWVVYLIVTIGGLVLAVYTSLISVLIALNIILLGLAYSLPVIRLKDRPLGGLAANALAYGFFIPILAARPVYSLDDLYSAVPYVLAIAAGYVFTAIPDLPGDKESGKKTIAVILGAGPARVIGTAFISVTAFAGFFVGNWELGVTALIGTAIGLVSCVKTNRSADLAAAKIPIFILLLFTAAHFPFFLLVILLTIILTRAYYKLKFDVTYPKLL